MLWILGKAIDDQPSGCETVEKVNRADVIKDVLEQIKPPQNELQNIFSENISFKMYDRQRINTFFVSKAESTQMSMKKPPTSVNFSRFSFDKAGFLTELKQQKPGSLINWTAWARNDFPVTYHGTENIPNNAGHILKEYAKAHGVDVNQFNENRNMSGREVQQRVRRHKRKLDDLYAIPGTRPAKKLKQELRSGVETGEYCLGQKITANGRHVPLTTVISQELKRCTYSGYIKRKTDREYEVMNQTELAEELKAAQMEPSTELKELIKAQRTVHIKIWHDHATIVGSSHYNVMMQVC